MKTYTEQLENLYEKARVQINKKIRKSKYKSQFFSQEKVIVVDDERSFNLGSSEYLIEIRENDLISNLGYLYNYSTLSYEDLMGLADWVKTLK